jgi:hypothetical protein
MINSKNLQISARENSFLLKIFTILFFLVISFSQVYSQGWSPLGGGTNWEYSLCVYNNKLYAGMQSGNGGSGLWQWDGISWTNIGNINGTVQAITVYNGNLIVGGSFSSAGGVSVLNIAQWDGSTWSDVGGGPDNIVSALTVYNGDLIVGGYFTTVENVNANHIAKYNGTNGWQPLGSGTGGSQGQVMALSAWNGNLIAGGFFTTAGGVSANYIAQWNGSTWSALGNGLSYIVYALGTYNNSLVAGGLFSGCAAQWNGTAWSILGSGCGGGFYPYVFAFAAYGNDLYIAGLYTTAGGQTVNGISRWDGTSYHPLGNPPGFSSGSNVFGAYALALYNGGLVAGGIFSSAGGVGAGNVAMWDGLTGISKSNHNVPDNFSLSQNYPNPFNPSTKISFNLPKSGNVELKVYNIIGKEVATVINGFKQAGSYEVTFDASALSSGVYFYRLTSGSFSSTHKMTLVK